ncbi:MAG: hypothetical protein J7L47_00210 [Candidatus Odinarchaeota archaeon]|nr:hypothetical protein [Candidatus Odinarchaeota archaeon]
MDLETQLIIFVIFGIVGFIMDKLIGINPYRIVSDISATLFILTLIFYIKPVSDSQLAIKNLENLITFFVDSLPSMIIGDIAGTIVSRITGEVR